MSGPGLRAAAASAALAIGATGALSSQTRARDAETPPALPLHLERLGSEHGLSHNTVYAIAQDTRGFLWFGTQDGLDRYDGRDFVAFRHEAGNTASLASNWIGALLVDRSGSLWVGTRAGLHRRRFGQAAFDRVPLAPDAAPTAFVLSSLAEDAAGRIWAGTRSGLFRLDPETLHATAFTHDPARSGSLGGDVVHAVRASPTGEVWALAEGPGQTFSLNRHTAEGFDRVTVPPTWTFEVTRDGLLHIAPGAPTAPGDLRDATRRLHIDQPIVAMKEDSHGRLWIGTFEGLFERTESPGTIRRAPTADLGAGALAGEVNTILEDRAGTVWIGTFGGVLRHDPHAKRFSHITHQPGDRASLSSNAVSSIVEDGLGRLWVGTFGAGLNEIDPQTGRIRHHRHRSNDRSSLCGDYIWDLAIASSAGIWVSTTTGLCRILGTEIEHHDVIEPCRNALTLREGADGTLWLGTSAGLCRYAPAARRASLVGGGHAGLADPVDTLHLTADGRVWLGSAGSGRLAVYDPRHDERRTFPDISVEGIWDIDGASDGALWLATGGGPVRFDPATAGVERVIDPRAAGSVYYSVLTDDRGRLWAGTNKGLVRVDPVSRAVRLFDLSDGIGNIEFNRHAALRTASGDLIFGGMAGLTRFTPATHIDNAQVPPVAFTAIHGLNDEGDWRRDPAGLESIALTPHDYAVTFEFAALNFTQGHKNRYAHRLEGFDASWIDAGTARSARYTSLPPGRYVMRVRGSNNDGVWNDEGASLAVVVLPPFWQTWWFRAAAAGGVAGALLIAYRIRVRRIREIERLRWRIASDLHDDLGSDLSGLALASAMIGRGRELTDRDRHRLDAVATTAVRVMEGLRDIVWHIDPEHDTLPSLELRMRALASSLLSGVQHDFEADGLSSARIHMNARRHLFLIYKEVLHNIVKHAGARHVRIRLALSDGRLDLAVTDDGAGIPDGGGGSGGSGLRNMHRRAREIGADLRIDGRPGGGTDVRLSVPLTRTRRGPAHSAPVGSPHARR